MNTSIGSTLAACGLLVGAIGMMPSPAHAATTFCTSSNHPISGSTVQGDLKVTSPNICQVTGITVTGNVVADPNTVLGVSSSTIGGNVVVSGGFYRFLLDQVGGNVVFSGVAAPGASAICASIVRGNLSIHDLGSEILQLTEAVHPETVQSVLVKVGSVGANEACAGNEIDGFVSITSNQIPVTLVDNRIGKNVSVSNNTGASPSVDIEANAIQQNLSCSGNSSLLGLGTNNVHGNETNQCQGF